MIDLFSMNTDIHSIVSGHVETVVLLCRKNEDAEKHVLVEYDTEGRHMDDASINVL